MIEKDTTKNSGIKTVHITKATHSEVKDHLEAEGKGRDIGKFFDEAGQEKLEREKKSKK